MKKSIKDQVKEILFNYPEANQSDMVLIERFCITEHLTHIGNIGSIPVAD